MSWKEREKEYQKEYRRANKEKIAAQKKKWRIENIDRIKEKELTYRKENREKLYKLTNLWKKENPDKVRLIERRRNLKKKYNITIEDFENLSKQQNNCCAICEKEEKLVVDHNHTTGQIRGLLCNDCNRNLIAQRDDPEIFYKAAKYLEREKVK